MAKLKRSKKELYNEAEAAAALDISVNRLHELLEFRPPEETESTTVGGLVTEWLGHVPHIGEVIERDGIRLEVLAGDELKVEQVRVSKVAPETVPETRS